MSEKSMLKRSLRLSDEVFGCVWYRKLYHFAAGSILLAAIVVLNANWLAAFCIVWILMFWAMSGRISTAVLGVLLLDILTASKLTAMGAATIFVVGDGMSALVGSAFGDRKWPWSDQKTILGSVAFFVGATFAMHSLLSVLIQDALHHRLLLGVLPSVIGGLAEAMPVTLVRDIRDSKPDDNLLVILSSGASLHWLITYLRIEGI